VSAAGTPSQALTRYHAMRESLLSRGRAPEPLKGLDRLAGWAELRVRHGRSPIGWLRREASRVVAMGSEYRGHSDAALDEAVSRIREPFLRRRADRETLRRALAMVREVARRETGREAYPVQVMGALALYHGRIVQMLTGEGKTLTGSLACPLLAWTHRHMHVLTVNDYLAARDAQALAPIYARCGCSTGAIQQDQEPGDRFGVYARSIVYGTPKQITADYLRDQLRIAPLGTPWAGRRTMESHAHAGGRPAGPIIPGLHAALVDEADAVLIDEGVVPLIIARSRREDEMAEVYRQACAIAARLDEGPDYSADRLRRRSELTGRGRHRARTMWLDLEAPIWRADRRAEELVRQAIVALACYHRGVHYEIVDGRVIIVDEYTGRFLHDRSWEHGLHQAVEAKEGLEVTADRETLARLSFQRFFRSYPFLCGMTGTAADATGEIETIYRRPVTCIPTNRPVIRRAMPTRVFRSGARKLDAVVEEVGRLTSLGRPVLIGTPSIAASDALSERLESHGYTHRVLNALNDADEAELIAEAGRSGAITVATNMAGRGTDIVLDDRARDAGGLAVILTEMHTAQRIDRQFVGRAGRQGDPGTSQIFLSLDDELITQHAPGLAALLRARTIGDELSHPRLARRAYRLAQRRAEARARRGRAAVLRQDDWIDKHLPGR